MGRKLGRQIEYLVAGCALGAVMGYAVALNIRLNDGRADLFHYAGRLSQVTDRIAAENSQAVAAISHDYLEFCSDTEIALMRDYVFRAQHIRELARTRDGKIYCTTGVGRLYPPVPTVSPDIVSGGMMLHKQVPLVIAEQSIGLAAEKDGVSIIFNANLVKDLEEPPMYYSAMYFDQGKKHMLAFFGPQLPLTIGEVLAAKPIERGGVLYQSVCEANATRCVVTFESKRQVLARRSALVPWFLLAGGVFGTALAGIILRIHRGRRSMESQLRRALRSESLTLVYQPIVNLATGKIVAAEALARWVDEDGESIGPDIFVALAEERGFAAEITRLVVGFAAEELSDILAIGSFRVSINIAPTDLADEDFFRHLDQSLASAQVDPSRIVLELTERSLGDHDTAVRAIGKLKSRGHRVYVDDFGIGYSNLASLHLLSVDGIKVDRAFTQTIATDSATASVVPQILEMAKQMELAVVVEGIETEEQAEYFRRAGEGILGQGWLFGKPMPAAQFRKLFRDGK